MPLDQRLHTGRSEVGPKRIWSGGSTVAKDITAKAPRGVIPSDFVGDGVNGHEVVRKGASGDLVIVSWVTPSAESTLRRIVEDGRVEKVGAGIYRAG